MGKKFKGMYMQKCGLRDGSLVPVTALLAQGLTDSSLKYHLQNAKNHGVTQKEIAAVITHAAFYAGWPKAWGRPLQHRDYRGQHWSVQALRKKIRRGFYLAKG